MTVPRYEYPNPQSTLLVFQKTNYQHLIKKKKNLRKVFQCHFPSPKAICSKSPIVDSYGPSLAHLVEDLRSIPGDCRRGVSPLASLLSFQEKQNTKLFVLKSGSPIRVSKQHRNKNTYT